MKSKSKQLIVVFTDVLHHNIHQHPADTYLPKPLQYLLNHCVSQSDNQQNFQQIIQDLFFQQASDSDLPITALHYAADIEPCIDDCIIEWNPVHIHADMRYLRMFDLAQHPLSNSEAKQLIAIINAHLQDYGITIEYGSANRWYSRLNYHPNLASDSAQQLTGVGLDLDTLSMDAKWQSVWTEIQMLLHDCTVNQQREQAGLPTINALWPWGGGRLGEVVCDRVDTVIGTDVLVTGLAKVFKLNQQDISNLDQIKLTGLLIINPTTAQDDIELLAEQYFKAIKLAFQSNVITEILLYGMDGKLRTLRKKIMYPFWRRDTVKVLMQVD